MLHKPPVNLSFSIKIQITHNIIAFVSRLSIMTNDAKMNRMAKGLIHLSFKNERKECLTFYIINNKSLIGRNVLNS